MFKNLEKALADRMITKKAYADFLGVCPKTIHNKFSGATDFRLTEMRKTIDVLFPGTDMLWLFEDCGNAQ